MSRPTNANVFTYDTILIDLNKTQASSTVVKHSNNRRVCVNITSSFSLVRICFIRTKIYLKYIVTFLAISNEHSETQDSIFTTM